MKRTHFIYTITLLMSFGLLFGQKTKEINDNALEVTTLKKAVSATFLTETPQMPLKLENAHYDPKRKNLPYFLSSKTIGLTSSIKGSLKNIRTVELSSEVSKKILSFYGAYITDQFQTETSYGQTGNTQIGYLKIIPYRLNSQNLIEELVSYEADLEVSSDNGSSQKTVSTSAFKNTSVLANGKWYKIGITKTGAYKIDKTFLQSIGVDVINVDPKNIRVYGNGGHMLPLANSAFRYDDLEENAIQFVGNENDGVLDNSDYIVFYGVGTDEWKHDLTHNFSCLDYYHQLSYFSDTSYYFINTDLGPGKRIISKPSLTGTPTNVVTKYDYYDYHEANITNFIKSGRNFYGEYFDLTTSYSFTYPIPGLVPTDTVYTAVTMAARCGINSLYSVSYCGTTSSFGVGYVNVNDYLSDYVALGSGCSKALANSTNIISFNITKQTPSAISWLDKLMFNCKRSLSFFNSQFSFRDAKSAAPGNVTNFVLSNPSNAANISIWDVSDAINPKNQIYNITGTQYDFSVNNDSLKEFLVFNGSDFLTPVFITQVLNQNLHAVAQADYVIVTYPGYIDQANRLAQIHQQNDSLTVSVVTTDQVYNEFSSGKPDIVGIRDFVRMLYKRNLSSGKEVKYLLLLGDGSYRTKDRYAYGNTALIPVFETENSYSPTLSTVSDDFFAWMDDSEGADETGALVDVGVGRFPVNTLQQATDAVSKVQAYYKKNYNFTLEETDYISSCTTTNCYPQGDWRNWVCFVADDEDYQQHMGDADILAKDLKIAHPEYNIDKIYADSYLQYTTPGGQRYPDASSAIDHRIEKGALVLNYTGHGGEVGLGHERYLELSQIQGYNNLCNMPLFVTATCEFSRFDDPERTSAGEYCFLNPNGAAIALLTTVRLAFSNTNLILNKNLYDFIFEPLPNGKMPALGDMVKLTKQKSGLSFYYLNFHLLGDPALRLAYPQKEVFTTSINGNPISSTVFDTIKALSKVTITGFVGSREGSKIKKLTDFNGVLFPTVFDKEQLITCLGNDVASLVLGLPFQFLLQKNIIYKGKVQVTNGDFTFTFMVPKDISYNYDLGKISYYAHNGVMDASGSNKNFYLGGSAKNVAPDNVGPTVSLYLNDKKFVSGGTTNEKPNLYAEVTDSSGINTVGTGIGHDIAAIIDENSSKPIILNDYYESNLNSYQAGKIKYPFNTLSEGNHRLSLKVWDVQNNSSVAYTDFVVAQSAEMALTHVLNYPNPFTTRTKFYFENNQCCNTLKVNIQIFTISGKVVKTISLNMKNMGFRSDAIDWDGKDDFGDKLAKGVYIYKISVTDPENKKAEKTEKLVILN